MNGTARTAVVGGTLLAAATAVFIYLDIISNKVPDDAIENMAFPAGLEQLVGDDNGTVCHDLRYVEDGRQEQIGKPHLIDRNDFRRITTAEKAAAIKSETREDLRSVGLACGDPAQEWLHHAYAQKQCKNCHCVSWTCPAEWLVGLGACVADGGNCAITTVCCGGGCNPNC